MVKAAPTFDLVETFRLRYPEMSAGQRAIADFIVQNHDEAQFLTAAQVAQRAGVSESAVVRFAQFLDFSGYPDLRRAICQDFRARATNRGLMFSSRAAFAYESDLISEIARQDSALVEETAHRLNPDTLRDCAAAILDADRVFVVGHRASYALAFYLASTLMQSIGVGTPLSFGSGMAFDILSSAKPNDILIAISITPYAQQTLNLLQAARRQGLRCIVLTDHPLGAPAQVADDVIVFETSLQAFTSSYVGVMTITHILLAMVSQQAGSRIDQFFTRADALNEEFAPSYGIGAGAPRGGDV
jgi:DNA-binding MurR/RpiR family transcriptional regulator